ncbi:CREB ATF bZIP transcription factor [Paramuricea clavata]|uniref:CREB ATF bZIP transcription factor n=1 Tax=Paramuricea clavata TaxID=317549 RepID=A0A6S7IFW5_PARCT|nr:CREB ATF bZIP transcription factor [Paramuricea clavata]
MTNTDASVSHDHDYCSSNLQDEKDIDFVVDNLINSSSPKSIDAEMNKVDSLCLSPAYSCDSGIDSFANDLVQGFGGEGDDLLNFLLDDDFGLESEMEGIVNFTKNFTNSSVETAKVDKAMTNTAKPPVGKTATTCTDELGRNRKNAENAKENRRKKKIYVEGLEKEVGQLRNEKNALMGKSNRLEKKVNKLENEVDYLKNVLANQSMLSKLIENVSKTPGVSLSTSFCSSRESSLKDNDCEKENPVSTRSASRKRACDPQPASNAKQSRSSSTASGGVCLHVKQSKVSIEFCHHCNKMAQD